MSRSFMLLLIVLAVLGFSFWYLLQNDGDSSLIRELKEGVGLTEKPQIPMPNDQIPSEFQSGNSRFSRGACKADSDCKAGGCSGEVCSSDPDVVSTCEFSDSFPNVQGYQCGCLPTKVCGWK